MLLSKPRIKLQYISDIHLETNKVPKIPRTGDYMALCGDIGNPFEKKYDKFLKTMSKQYKGVFVVPGNHEYYNTTIGAANRRMSTISNKYENVHLLMNSYVDVDENVRILGSTLWSNMPLELESRIGDFKKIGISLQHGQECTKCMQYEVYNRMHNASVRYLDKQIKKARIDGKKVVILSHHAPHSKMLGRFAGTHKSAAYATDLDNLIVPPVIAWISGHTHVNICANINGVVCVANCHGLDAETTSFDPSAMLEL